MSPANYFFFHMYLFHEGGTCMVQLRRSVFFFHHRVGRNSSLLSWQAGVFSWRALPKASISLCEPGSHTASGPGNHCVGQAVLELMTLLLLSLRTQAGATLLVCHWVCDRTEGGGQLEPPLCSTSSPWVLC